MRGALLASVAFVAVGCAKDIKPEYAARRAAVLAPPTEVPAGWDGDGYLVLSDDLFDELVGAALDKSGAFRRKVELGRRAHFTPALALTQLSFLPSDRCDTCVRVEVELDGRCSWQIGNSSGERPLSGHIDFDAEISAVRQEADWVVQLAPRDVHEADLELGGRTFRTIQKLASGTIQDWATEHLFENIKPIPITRFEADLPLRAVRVRTERDHLALELLTEAPAVDLVDPPTLQKGDDWALGVSQAALLHAARKAAFNKGELAHDVFAEPLDLRIDKGTFILDLRLWRLKGRGWWRDYRIRGTWTRVDGGFDFQAVEADETGRSKGARTVDPLAALAENKILHAVERAVSTTLPGGMNRPIGKLAVKPVVQSLAPRRDGVVARGTASISSSKKKPVRKPTSGGNGNR